MAERLYNTMEVGQTYLIARGQLKVANKKFSTLNAAYEINLGFDSMVQLSTDDGSALPKIRYTFVPIAEVADKPTNAVIDVIGVVTDVSPVQNITTKAGRELKKRTAKLADDSGMSIELTMWGATADTFPEGDAKIGRASCRERV